MPGHCVDPQPAGGGGFYSSGGGGSSGFGGMAPGQCTTSWDCGMWAYCGGDGWCS
ncbi:MAG: hypothetical protein QM811_09290 [Pirellulales bacterium]